MPNRSTWLMSNLAALALLGLAGCGGSNNGPSALPAPTPRPTPATTTLSQGSFTGLEPGQALSLAFQAAVTGDLEAVVDWTFATNNLDVVLARGTRTCVTAANVVDFSTCTVVATELSPTNKPERMRVAGLAAGAYTMYIGNFGTSSESLSYQFLLTYTPSAGEPGGNVFRLSSEAPQPFVFPVGTWR